MDGHPGGDRGVAHPLAPGIRGNRKRGRRILGYASLRCGGNKLSGFGLVGLEGDILVAQLGGDGHDGFFLPPAHAEGQGGEDGADDPGDEQGQDGVELHDDTQHMPLDQSLGFLATMLTEAAATRPCAIPESRPPRAMGRQAARISRPFCTVSSLTVPLNRPIFSRARKPITRPYRPWVPGITCRIMHLEN